MNDQRETPTNTRADVAEALEDLRGGALAALDECDSIAPADNWGAEARRNVLRAMEAARFVAARLGSHPQDDIADGRHGIARILGSLQAAQAVLAAAEGACANAASSRALVGSLVRNLPNRAEELWRVFHWPKPIPLTRAEFLEEARDALEGIRKISADDVRAARKAAFKLPRAPSEKVLREPAISEVLGICSAIWSTIGAITEAAPECLREAAMSAAREMASRALELVDAAEERR